MLLLDRVTSIDSESFEGEVCIRPDSLFCQNGAVGAWVGVEYMAQTIAAFAGEEGHKAGKPIKVGFLLGSRQYEAKVPAFKVGLTLTVRVVKVLYDPSGLSVLDCVILDRASGETLAKAALNVFEVDDLQAYLKEH
jgi:3-oxoacyl-[acyl-carrier-protein] synthase-1